MKISDAYPCNAANYTRGRGGKTVDHIAVHYTGTTASALNNAKYFNRSKVAASAHYFIDGSGTAYRSVAEGDTAWAVGNFAMNQRSISIEVVSAGADFTEAEVTELAELVRDLMARYGVGAGNVIRHYDVTGKRCPAPYVDAAKWASLKARITGGASKPSATPTATGYTVKVATAVLKVRKGPGTDYAQAGTVKSGEVYTIVQESAGKGATIWGKLKSGAGWIALDYTAKTGAAQKSLTEVAREVIAGKWGNGADRKARLKAAGYDPAKVQAEVNKLL